MPRHGAKFFLGDTGWLIWIQDGVNVGVVSLFIFREAFDELVSHFVESAPADALEFIDVVD